MKRTIVLAGLVAAVLISGEPASAASNEADARALFTAFIVAQNAHDISAVKSMLWKSPETLLYSRGIEARGTEAVAQRFAEYYHGTWQLKPDMTKFEISTISDNVVQILVPIVFMRGLPGAKPRSNTFLISQTYVKGDNGWRVAVILPIANTQLK